MKSLKAICTTLVLILPLWAAAQGSLIGNWEMAIPAEDGTMMKAMLTISDDNTFAVDFGVDGTADVKGLYEMKDDVITIIEKETPFEECKGVKGVYKFTIDAASMVMERIDDPCPGRSGESGVMQFSRSK